MVYCYLSKVSKVSLISGVAQWGLQADDDVEGGVLYLQPLEAWMGKDGTDDDVTVE